VVRGELSSPTTMPEPSIKKIYRERADRFEIAATAARERIRALSNARFLTFIIGVIVLWQLRSTPLLLSVTALVVLVIFSFLVIRQRAARAHLLDLEAKIELCGIGVSRLGRDWNGVPIVLSEPPMPDHAYAGDIELFGRPALTQLFGPVHTLHGQRMLRNWLLTRAHPDVVRARQQAVQLLAPDIDFREELSVAARESAGTGHQRLLRFIDWVSHARLPEVPAAIVWFARAIPVLTVTLGTLQIMGVLARAWWLLPFTAGAVFSGLTLRRIHRTFDAAFAQDPGPLRFARAFMVAQRAPAGARLLDDVRAGLHTHGSTAAQQLRRLEQIMLYADVRHSGSASIILELFFLWSFHIALALRAWQEQARADLPAWFDALGTLEAVAAIGTLAHDQPDWCFPELDNELQQIEAVQLGHPMLRNDRRVANDVVLGPPGTLLLVTGSNMSGKSTLLRSIGVNTVLAQAGAPVCATAYRAPVLRLYTSVNVRDSLAAGVSLYLAQLRRIKTVLDAAEAEDDALCCYLLDEILSGTNSRDRTTAVRAIVHRLLQLPAIGALATHDLALAADERIGPAARSIHFRETINPTTGAMSFDYRIREGSLQTTNAIALLELMGIKIEG
jgi:hypothetical protein